MPTTELDSETSERTRAISVIPHGESPTGKRFVLATNEEGELIIDSLEDCLGAILEQLEALTLAVESGGV